MRIGSNQGMYALVQNPDLSDYSGFVQDSGEGRWTVTAAVELAVPVEVLSASLYTRFRSRQAHTFAEKAFSAMRKQFGGHVEPTSATYGWSFKGVFVARRRQLFALRRARRFRFELPQLFVISRRLID